MIKAVIFDLDGVIVDTAHYHFIAWFINGKAEHIKAANNIGNGGRSKDRNSPRGPPTPKRGRNSEGDFYFLYVIFHITLKLLFPL